MTTRSADFYQSHELYLARVYADRAGWFFVWEDDQDGDHSYLDQVDEETGNPLFPNATIDRCEVVDLFDADGKLLSSLGCIDDADQDYRDELEADRAIEAMGHDSECGHCGKTWNSILTPTPAARCPFEYDHDSEDGEA